MLTSTLLKTSTVLTITLNPRKLEKARNLHLQNSVSEYWLQIERLRLSLDGRTV